MTINQMCIEANLNIAKFVNQSAAQHLRAMRNPVRAPTAAEIYDMAMESDIAYKLCPWLCKQAGIAYPPTIERAS